MPLIHISDLHVGGATLDVVDALREIIADVAPELVVATGDLSHRGRAEQLGAARELLAGLGAPVLAVPGNHDVPHSARRLVQPWTRYERLFGTIMPVLRSPALVVVGLCSARPWRHQSGRLDKRSLAHVERELTTSTASALRVVALHHQLANAPWRATRKRPLRDRDGVVELLAGAGADLVLGGHIHQSSAVQMHEVTADSGRDGALVLTTAPGLGRPRPHRRGEAQGLHVVDWDEATLTIDARLWDGARFALAGRRSFPRSRT